MQSRGLLGPVAMILIGLAFMWNGQMVAQLQGEWINDGLVVESASQGNLSNRTLADLILMARRDFDREPSRTATLWFRDGSFEALGNLSEIGADFVCTLTISAPPVVASENTPPLQTERCIPVSEIVSVTFDQRIGR